MLCKSLLLALLHLVTHKQSSVDKVHQSPFLRLVCLQLQVAHCLCLLLDFDFALSVQSAEDARQSGQAEGVGVALSLLNAQACIVVSEHYADVGGVGCSVVVGMARIFGSKELSGLPA